jgi:Leucine-rich repeat (LRR) protein
VSDEQLILIESLRELEVLDVSHNHIKEQTAIQVAERLPNLKVFLNNMNEYTEIIFDRGTNELEEIHLDENSLYTIEVTTVRKSVKVLSVKGNQLQDLSGISKFVNLEVVACDNNKVRNLENMKVMEYLRILTATSNGTTSICFPSNGSLEHVDLSDNNLDSMNFLKDGYNLVSLKLSENNFTTFMECAVVYDRLVKLDLS